MNKFDEKLKERYFNTYKLSTYDNNNFIFLLWKDVYPNEYIEIGKNLIKHHYLKKKIFIVT